MKINRLPNWPRYGAKSSADAFFDNLTGLGLALSSVGFVLAIAIQFWNAA